VSEGGSKAEVWAVNVGGAQNVVEAALANGVERFVHLSSCAVYGSLQQYDIDENTPTRLSGNLYHDSKVAAEEVVFRAYQERDLPVVVVRPSQVYGPGSYQFAVRPVELIKAGRMILIDQGSYLCKPVYIDNLVDGLILCAQVESAIGQVINLTDGTPITWRDFFGAYARMLNIDSFPSVPFALAWVIAFFNEIRAMVKGKQASLNRRVVKALRSRNSFSNQKARTLLGWEPKVDFTEGMGRTETWLRAEGYIK
jgi:nucleoside-diphosphate-sugar epimerase